jgi:hypothetical protein
VGRYVLEPVDDVPPLTPEEEEGLEMALESLRDGKATGIEAVRQKLDQVLRR